jgi:hypothetical protein
MTRAGKVGAFPRECARCLLQSAAAAINQERGIQQHGIALADAVRPLALDS